MSDGLLMTANIEFEYTITGNHPIFARVDKKVFTYSEMVMWKQKLREQGYELNITQRSFATGNIIALPVK